MNASLSHSAKYWRVDKANRVGFLIDCEAYFRTLYEVFALAKRSIFIAGWELDPEVRLIHEASSRELPAELEPLLSELLDREKGLEVRLLPWDYTPGLAGKLLTPIIGRKWARHDRLVFYPDGSCAAGASHHQKIVVVDDAIAFCGGMDLTSRRWDTSEHRAHDPRRTDRAGTTYQPWHDVQVVVDGAAAAALGELFRERWRRATGELLVSAASAKTTAHSLWPHETDVEIRNAPVGISRTDVAVQGDGEVREIEQLYLDALTRARRFNYIENQYMTSVEIGDAIAARLQEAGGPEVVLVLPKKANGWLEEGLMSALRARLLNRLTENDRFNRLRVYRPVVPDLGEDHIDVHSKLLIVDGTLVSVGSANVSNRSMKVDSECNLTVEAGRSRRRADGIQQVLYRLLAEHLGRSVEDVGRSFSATGSLIATIDGLGAGKGGSARTLAPLSNDYPEWIQEVAPTSSLTDPEAPMKPRQLVEAAIPSRLSDLTNEPLLKMGLALGALSLAGSWWVWRRARN